MPTTDADVISKYNDNRINFETVMKNCALNETVLIFLSDTHAMDFIQGAKRIY